MFSARSVEVVRFRRPRSEVHAALKRRRDAGTRARPAVEARDKACEEVERRRNGAGLDPAPGD